MDHETFTLRKKFLEEFLKERVKLINTNIDISQSSFIDFNVMDYVDNLSFKTCVIFNTYRLLNNNHLNIDVKEVYKLIKPFIYYLFSVTYKEKFLQGKLLLTEKIKIKYSFRVDDDATTTVDKEILTDYYDYETLADFSFLEYYNEKGLSKNYAGNSVNIHYLHIFLHTFYVFLNYDEYVSSVGELEERGEIFVSSRMRLREIADNSQSEDSSDDDDEEKIINSSQTFKSNECVICLTNSPNILFCNCGHIPICKECDKIKTLSSCPVCKTENTILRLIE